MIGLRSFEQRGNIILTMRNYDRLVFSSDVITVLPRQHINFALVHTHLTDVSLTNSQVRFHHYTTLVSRESPLYEQGMRKEKGQHHLIIVQPDKLITLIFNLKEISQ